MKYATILSGGDPMNYIFDIFLTEEDYIDFNIFHLVRSVYR